MIIIKTVIEEEKCTGCSACKNVCPQKCIAMKRNSEGFLYPVINEKKCIHCNLCKRTCPILNKAANSTIPKTILAKNRNFSERISSSSGGVFSLIANYVIENGGIVYGAIYSNKKVFHIGVEKKEDLDKLKESKYVQSDVSNVFLSIKDNLNCNRLVLFVGTGCQVGGLKAFLGKDYDNLYTCDMICHGVPSPKVFEDYCTYLEEKYKSKIKEYHFRNKDISWRFYSTKVVFENKKVYKTYFLNDLYMRGFLSNVTLRKNCFNCVYRERTHVSDITLGDYWGHLKYHKDFNDKKGTSVVFINSVKGERIISKLNSVDIKELPFEEAVYMNPWLYSNYDYNKKRDTFFKEYKKQGVIKALESNSNKTPKWKKALINIAIRFIK